MSDFTEKLKGERNMKENYIFIIAKRGTAKAKAMQEYYNKFIKERKT